MPKNATRPAPAQPVPKSPTGIQGLDEITLGGLPRGRSTLICGGPGCGKTILAMEFLINGARQFGEPGVFLSFEESVEDMALNFASLGLDPRPLAARKKLALDYVRVEPHEIQETGAYDLNGLFIRLEHAIDSIGAKRVALDTIETLFSGLSDTRTLRAELRRLLDWLKAKGVTAIVTGERGDSGRMTRHGLEEYITDCVIVLDHRVEEQNATRRLRVVKYRGSPHGANESPFFIDESGLSVLPITSLGLQHRVSAGRISTGVPDLDTMLGGKGYYRASSVLVSGGPGTGKTSLAGYFAEAACRRGDSVLYFAFEESAAQIGRNLRSIGLDLEPSIRKKLLHVYAARPTTTGLEGHLSVMHRLIEEQKPRVVVVDPISNLIAVGTTAEVKAMLARLIDFMKVKEMTSMFTSLTMNGQPDHTDYGVSSFMDTWLVLRNIEKNGERTRTIDVVKSRGMPHTNQVREFILTSKGLQLLDVVRHQGRVLIGSERAAHADGAPVEPRRSQRSAARR